MFIPKQRKFFYKISYRFNLFSHFISNPYNYCSQNMEENIRDKSRADMKKFIGMRRNQVKQNKEGSGFSLRLKQLITQNNFESLQAELQKANADQVYNFLFIEDDLLRTPLSLALQQKKWSNILDVINKWSVANLSYVESKFLEFMEVNNSEGRRNQLHFLMKRKSEAILKLILTNKSLNAQEVQRIFTENNSILSRLMALFLQFDSCLALIPEQRQQEVFRDIVLKIAEKLNVPDRDKIRRFVKKREKEKIWKELSFRENLDKAEILQLRQVNYNFLHELTIKKQYAEINNIVDKMNSSEEGCASEDIQTYFCTFDSAGQTPIDIALSKWPFPEIQNFLKKAKESDSIIFSINSLNKVIANTRLAIKQVQYLIQELLHGQISHRGYSQRIFVEKFVKTKVFSGIVKNQDSGYVIVMDNRKILMSKDKRESYPLLNYLDRFNNQCSLKIISKLFPSTVDRQVIKSKVITLLKRTGIECQQYNTQNEALKDIEEIIYYHQSLINYICRLPHNDILEYFIDKLYINYFSISIWSKANGKPVLHMINRHFLTNYISVHQNLQENKLNRKIIDKIFSSKENQKFAGGMNLYVELLRQFNQYRLSNIQNWVVKQIKSNLKQYFLQVEKQKFIQIFTFYNQGQKQKKVFLIDLINPIFTAQELPSLNLPERPTSQEQEKEKKRGKKIPVQSPQQKMKKYALNRTFANFCDDLSRRLAEFKQRLRLYEELKRKVELGQATEQEKQQVQPKVEEWLLQIDEPDLDKKFKKLNEQGFPIIFKTNRCFFQNKQQKIIQSLEQPYRAIVKSMMKVTSSSSKKKNSQPFHIACLKVDDEEVQIVASFLETAPQKFKQIACDWQNKCLTYLNPFMLQKILKSKELSRVYRMNQQDTLHSVWKVIHLQTNRIINSLRKQESVPSHIKKMLIFRDINKSIKEKLGYSHNKINQYLSLHSEKIDLSQYLLKLSGKEIFEYHQLQQLYDFSYLSAKPIEVLLELRSFLDNLEKDLAALTLQKQEGIEKNGSDFQLEDGKQTKFSSLSELKANFDIEQNKYKQLPSFLKLMQKLSIADFIKYLEVFPPKKFRLVHQLTLNIQNPDKLLIVFDYFLKKNMRIQQLEDNSKEKDGVIDFNLNKRLFFLVKHEQRNYCAALSAFFKEGTKFSFSQQGQGKKKLIEYKAMLMQLPDQAYQIYLKYLGKMLSFGKYFYNQNEKMELLNGIASQMFLLEKWDKLSKLFQFLNFINYKVQQKQKLQAGQLDCVQGLLLNSLKLANQKSFNHKQYKLKNEFAGMVKSLFKLLTNHHPSQNEDLFLYSWVLNPQQSVKSIKLSSISFMIFVKCLNSSPECLQLISSLKMQIKSFPPQWNSKTDRELLPISSYSAQQVASKPYLIDLIILQQELKNKWVQSIQQGTEKISKYIEALKAKKKCIFLTKQAMQRYKQVYSHEQIKQFSAQIFNSKKIKSLKQIPKEYVDSYFEVHAQIKGICNLEQSLLKQLIDFNYISKQRIWSVIKSNKITSIQYFLNKFGMKIDMQTIKQIQQRDLKNISFVLSILGFDRQDFIIQFFTKFNILSLYKNHGHFEQLCSQILWAIPIYQRTEFLSVFLTDLIKLLKIKDLNFVQAIQMQNGNFSRQSQNSKVDENGTVHLPMKVAAGNNFYQYYFLLKQSNPSLSTKAKFSHSSRFVMQDKIERFHFIPLMEKRLKLLKTMGQICEENKNKNFFKNSVFSPIFEIQMQQEGKKHKIDKSLYEFLKQIRDGEYELSSETKSNYLIILVLKKVKDIKIANEDLMKYYPQETSVVLKIIERFPITIQVHNFISIVVQQEKKQMLARLLYMRNPQYMLQRQPLFIWCTYYHQAFAFNVRFFELPQNLSYMEQFVEKCFYPENYQENRYEFEGHERSTVELPFNYRYNQQKMKDIFISCIVSKFEGNGSVYKKFCQLSYKGEDEMLIDLAIDLCTLKTFNAENPILQRNVFHNTNFWNNVIKTLKKMEQVSKFEKTNTFKPFFHNKYETFLKYQQNAHKLKEISQGPASVFNAISYLRTLVYVIAEQKQLEGFSNSISPEEADLRIVLSDNFKIEKYEKEERAEILFYLPSQIIEQQKVRWARIQIDDARSFLERQIFWQKLQKYTYLISERNCLSTLTFKTNMESFKQIKSLSILKKVTSNQELGSLCEVVDKKLQQLNNKVNQYKETKTYSLSDVYGPVVINDDTDKSKVIECLSYYEISKLPDREIEIEYDQNPPQQSGACFVSDIKQYIRHFTYQINDDQEQNKTPYKFSNKLYITAKKDNPDSFRINYEYFFVSNILLFMQKIAKAGYEMSSTFNFEITVKYSALSIIKLVEAHVSELKSSNEVLSYIVNFLNAKRNINFLENLLIMISEDAQNIMKATKGILIVFDYNQKHSLKADQKLYKINQKLSYYGINYLIDDQIFKINLKIGKSTGKEQLDSLQSNLISRKQFLNTIFSSTQFLTAYFLNKTAISNELVRISKQITENINSLVSFSINYKELEKFVDNIKQTTSIKEIDGIITNLSTYIFSNFKKFIQNYISSKELSTQHQIAMINYFDRKSNIQSSGNRGSLQQLTYKIGNTKNSIAQIYNFSSQLKSSGSKEVNIKNMYLIQIYKSYFASVVREGMTFILGFKTTKPTLIIKLQKKEDVDKVNVTELSFLLLISTRVPTNDEIAHNKIIKIFVTDLNENVYEIHKEIEKKLLTLDDESQERILANKIPVLQPNVILIFNSQYSGDQSDLLDNSSNRYLQLKVSKDGKYKLQLKNKQKISCLNLLRIDPGFNIAIENLKKSLRSFISSDIQIGIKVPEDLQLMKAIQMLSLSFIDFEQMLYNVFYDPPRNKDLEIFASVEKGEDIRQNVIYRHKKICFERFYKKIVFEIKQKGHSKISVDKQNILVDIGLQSNQPLNQSFMSDTLIKDLIANIVERDPKLKKCYSFNYSSEEFVTLYDHLLIGNYQIEAIENSIRFLQQLGTTNLAENFSIVLQPQIKTGIYYDKNNLKFGIRLKSPNRQFFSEQRIALFCLNSYQSIPQPLFTTKYNYFQKCIEIYNHDITKPITLITVNQQEKIHKEELQPDFDVNTKRSSIFKQTSGEKKYFIIQKQGTQFNVTSNYFWREDPALKYITEKKNSRKTNEKISFLFASPISINMAQCTINLLLHLTKNQKANDVTSITKKTSQLDIHLHLLSKQILLVDLSVNVTSNLTLLLGKYKLVQNEVLQSLSISNLSSGALVQENTKFVQLIFRNKAIKASQYQGEKKDQLIIFSQPAQKMITGGPVAPPKKQKNVQQMVYVVNESSRKFLTRAGEDRIDVINVCDSQGNPISFTSNIRVFFRHLNIAEEIIIPEITVAQDQTRVQLKWTPKIRGPYEVYLNNTRLNPGYELGVCAAFIDLKCCNVQIPKKTQICFMEETEFTMTLRDNFGNIYTELEQTIINDSLIVQVLSDDLEEKKIKMKSDKIDKYGIKKIRFSIDDPIAQNEQNLKINLMVNMEKLAEFNLKLRGQSLNQRRKNLQSEIDSQTKKYYIDITVSRNNFIQNLFKIAEKSLDKNFSVKFAGEQGIDAGGLKREFYDMIGREMKNPQNPFFIQTDFTRHNQYFINPEILKNKKKLQYMELFGKYLANSIMNGYLIGINFSSTFIKLLYEDSIQFDDMLAVLPIQEAKRYQFLPNADEEYLNDLEIYFSYIENRKKGIQIQMIQNGKNVKVTKDNIFEYLGLLPKFLIVERYKQIIESFRKGFDSVFKLVILRKWIRPDQFWCLTAGVKEITPQIVLQYVVIQGGKETHHTWFRTYINESSKQILEGFLKFSSGSSSIDFYKNSKITVIFENQGENPKKLPISHTCWKQIQIPAYKSYPIMKQLLNAAFLYCSQGFGFG